MRGALTILKKELAVYAVTPLAYVLVGVYLFLAGLFFWMGITLTGEASLRILVSNLAVVQLFVLPMLTMRAFAEERRQGTLELLLTCPVPVGAVVLGKWLAALALCALLLLGTGLFPVVLAVYGSPDWGIVATSYLGLALVAATFCAAGLFASSLTDDQVAAGLLGIVMLLPLWLVARAADMLPDGVADAVRPFSLLGHLQSFDRGVLDSVDVLYFVLLCGFFLFLTWRSLESRRWR
jgi:ABC-2 type transport system permease protein